MSIATVGFTLKLNQIEDKIDMVNEVIEVDMIEYCEDITAPAVEENLTEILTESLTYVE